MATIIVKAKVEIITDEDELLTFQGKDLGTMDYKSKKWLYKRFGIPAEDIRRVIAYTRDKTLLEDSDGKFILVGEPFEEVYAKWKANYEELDTEQEDEGTEINEDGENNSEEDDD